MVPKMKKCKTQNHFKQQTRPIPNSLYTATSVLEACIANRVHEGGLGEEHNVPGANCSAAHKGQTSLVSHCMNAPGYLVPGVVSSSSLHFFG